jgi:hypothetical protein
MAGAVRRATGPRRTPGTRARGVVTRPWALGGALPYLPGRGAPGLQGGPMEGGGVRVAHPPRGAPPGSGKARATAAAGAPPPAWAPVPAHGCSPRGTREPAEGPDLRPGVLPAHAGRRSDGTGGLHGASPAGLHALPDACPARHSATWQAADMRSGRPCRAPLLRGATNWPSQPIARGVAVSRPPMAAGASGPEGSDPHGPRVPLTVPCLASMGAVSPQGFPVAGEPAMRRLRWVPAARTEETDALELALELAR